MNVLIQSRLTNLACIYMKLICKKKTIKCTQCINIIERKKRRRTSRGISIDPTNPKLYIWKNNVTLKYIEILVGKNNEL